jgi:ribonuclease HII
MIQNVMLKVYYKEDIPEIGIDEAGRGPLWGPMMAAAVILPDEECWTKSDREFVGNIKDSKKISEKKRSQLSEKIKEFAIGYGIGYVTPEEIDTWGATRANQTAFRRAIENLYTTIEKPSKIRLLIDGVLPLPSIEEYEEQQTIIDGDATYLSIAAASILAKVAHDTWVVDWCKENVADAAKYDLLKCKGYGTANHRNGIVKHGYTELHRRLYLRKLIPDIVVSRCKIIEE